MKSKLEQYSQSLKKALGTIIYKEIPDVPSFTIRDVLVDPSLQSARVWLQTTEDGVKLINDKRSYIQAGIKKFIKSRYTPRLTFIQDDEYLDTVDSLFDKLKNEDPNAN